MSSSLKWVSSLINFNEAQLEERNGTPVSSLIEWT